MIFHAPKLPRVGVMHHLWHNLGREPKSGSRSLTFCDISLLLSFFPFTPDSTESMKCRPQANQGLADEEGIKRSNFPHVTVANANPIFLPALFNRFISVPRGFPFKRNSLYLPSLLLNGPLGGPAALLTLSHESRSCFITVCSRPLFPLLCHSQPSDWGCPVRKDNKFLGKKYIFWTKLAQKVHTFTLFNQYLIEDYQATTPLSVDTCQCGFFNLVFHIILVIPCM